jgi:hypothetical protein
MRVQVVSRQKFVKMTENHGIIEEKLLVKVFKIKIYFTNEHQLLYFQKSITPGVQSVKNTYFRLRI